MSADIALDEYIFWKSIIEKKHEAGELIPGIMYELLEQAQKKTMYSLMEKFSISHNDINSSTISAPLPHS